MFKILIGLLLSGSVAQATYFPNDCPLKIAGRCYTQVQLDRFESGTLAAGGGIIVNATITLANHVTGFTSQAGVDFQVPAGTVATCTGFRSGVGSGSAIGAYNAYLAYSDTPVPRDSGSFGTNPVPYGVDQFYAAFVVNQNPTENTLIWKIPAGKYPVASFDSAVINTTAWCLID